MSIHERITKIQKEYENDPDRLYQELVEEVEFIQSRYDRTAYKSGITIENAESVTKERTTLLAQKALISGILRTMFVLLLFITSCSTVKTGAYEGEEVKARKANPSIYEQMT